MSPAPAFRLLLITDRRLTPDLPAAVEEALSAARPGEVAVMLREKDLPARALLELAGILRRITRAAGAPLLVNERVDVALAAQADGVHLPSSGLPPAAARRLLGPGRWIGASTHDRAQAQRAQGQGADYVTFSPIFATPGKGPPLGLEALAALRLGLPVYALGGVDPEQARAVRGAGAQGAACIRAVLAAQDRAAATRAFLEALR